MKTIDVNTGSYVGGRSLEDTVFKTNMEATQVIARQLRQSLSWLQSGRSSDNRPTSKLREFVRLFEYLLQHYKDQIVVARIYVDSREIHAKLLEFVDEFVPNMKSRLIHYPGERRIYINFCSFFAC
jgi:Ribonuclease G/E